MWVWSHDSFQVVMAALPKLNLKLMSHIHAYYSMFSPLGSSMANKELSFRILAQDPSSQWPMWRRSTSATILVWLPTSWVQPTRACPSTVSKKKKKTQKAYSKGLQTPLHEQEWSPSTEYAQLRPYPNVGTGKFVPKVSGCLRILYTCKHLHVKSLRV